MAQVDQLELPGRHLDQNVVRLDVAVADTLLVHLGQRGTQLMDVLVEGRMRSRQRHRVDEGHHDRKRVRRSTVERFAGRIV